LGKFTFVDLFAGVGGFHHALASPEFGGECVFAADIDPDCRAVYRAYFPDLPIEALAADIRDFTQLSDGKDRPLAQLATMIPDHDVLCAGFPCQPFSKSGAQQGILDTTRGTLFFDIMRVVLAKKPTYLILENVRNLAGPRHTDTWATIVNSLRDAGYRVASEPVVFSPHFLPPDRGGTPQSRDRVFILARRVDKRRESVVGEPLAVRGPEPHWDPNDWDIHQLLLPDNKIDNLQDYRLSQKESAWIDAWQAFVQGITDDSLPGFPIWVDEFRRTPKIDQDTPDWKADFLEKNSDFYRRHRGFLDEWQTRQWITDDPQSTVRDFPASRRKFEWQARTAQPTRSARDLWQLTLHMRPSGIRVKPATYLPALVAITQTSIIGSRRRRITPTEAARLQGWPDDLFVRAGVGDQTAYKQAGNGVHSGVVMFMAQRLFEDGGHDWGHAPAPRAKRLDVLATF
jgi:DNA (cytosine-5)-methyltransferase 1